MEIVKVDSIGEAWLQACDAIMAEGADGADGDEKMKEIMHLLLEIQNPKESDKIIDAKGDRKMLEWMNSNFTEQKLVPELSNSMSYGTRLFNYNGKNQVQWVIDKLRKKLETKAATIPMLMPNDDKGYIPCVSLLDFKVRGGKLTLTVFCRSIDFGEKAYANMVALARLQAMVAKEVGAGIGPMVMHVASAHIYEKDFESVKSVLKD